MKIALLGYGKMGKIIEEMAIERGHQISFIASSNNKNYSISDLNNSDLAIEFSTPNSVLSNISKCFEAKIPVVVGTTGWYDKYTEVEAKRRVHNGKLLYATNFSVGVNIFYEINRQLAALMNHQKQYNVNLEEIHHTEKLDAPSGTAISIAEGILDNYKDKSHWVNQPSAVSNELSIESKREPNVPGTHIVTYDSDVDYIELKHEAKNRKGFALGAVLAAEFLKDQTEGMYTMQDVLKLK